MHETKPKSKCIVKICNRSTVPSAKEIGSVVWAVTSGRTDNAQLQEVFLLLARPRSNLQLPLLKYLPTYLPTYLSY